MFTINFSLFITQTQQRNIQSLFLYGYTYSFIESCCDPERFTSGIDHCIFSERQKLQYMISAIVSNLKPILKSVMLITIYEKESFKATMVRIFSYKRQQRRARCKNIDLVYWNGNQLKIFSLAWLPENGWSIAYLLILVINFSKWHKRPLIVTDEGHSLPHHSTV